MKTPNPRLGFATPAIRLYLAAIVCTLCPVLSPAQGIAPAITNLWRIPPGQEYDFLAAADNNVRGVAINPANGNVLYASRAAGSNHIAVVDPTTGFVSNRLSGTGITGGTLALVSVKVAEDGVVYAANLAAATSVLKLYRWDSDATTDDPLNVLFLSGVTTRYGDTMDLRGGGLSTEIIIAGSGGASFGLMTTADGTNFTMVEIPLPTGLAPGDIGKGIAFDGDNDAFYAKKDGSTPIRYVTFDRINLTSTLVTNITVDSRLVGLDLLTTNDFKVAAGALYGSGAALAADQHRVHFWDITTPNAPQLIGDDPMPGPYFANGNAIGAVDAQNGRFAVLEPNNVVALYQVYLVTNPPPGITAQPVGNTNILEGGYYRLSVGASGAGLNYQWWLDNSPVAGATNASLSLTNLSMAEAGTYSVMVTNAGGAITSSNAVIGLLPSVRTAVSAKLWQLLPGSRSYLTADNTQRGMAFNALSNHVLIANRSGAPSINILDAATGNNIGTLDMTGVGGQPGETFPINQVGVAEDGAIYVCNLTTSGGGFTIYRWADEDPTTQATIAYGPDFPASERIGDTFAVTGYGVNTRLIAATRNGTQVAVFTTADGVYFSPNIVDAALAPTPAPAGFAGLGLAAGDADSFWATSGSFLLRKVVYDLVNATNDVVLALAGQTGNNIGVDSANNLVADTGTGDTPSNLRLLDVSDPTLGAVLVDQEFFGQDNDNINGTGAVAFDVAGGRIFALDSNNGLIALKYAPRLNHASNVFSWTGPGALQSATDVAGPYSDVGGASSPYTNNATGPLFFRVRR